MPANPVDAVDLRARVADALDAFLARVRPRLDDAGPDLALVGDVVADLVGAGKRLRPAFCYWGWRGAGAPDGAEIVSAAASLDLLHACAIVHDDVMDGSDTRRGKPATHRRFADVHRRDGWRGDPAAFGDGAAILLGDLCLAWSDEMFATCGLPMDTIVRARSAYDAMRTEVMAGQYLDLLEQARGGGSVDRAMRVVRYKSAKYTIERPLHIGGLLAGGPPELLDSYSGYGLPLGEAFQLRDDVLGVFGDPEVTGKPAGDDVREGKRTVLLALAMDRATPTQQSVLDQYVGDPAIASDGVDEVRSVLSDTGAVDEVERLITSLTEQAVTAIDASAVERDVRDVFADLAIAATNRQV